MTNDKKAYSAIVFLSLGIFAYLFWLIYFKEQAVTQLSWTNYLPATNATLNTITSLLLLLGFYQIKSGRKEQHIKTMMSAVLTSGLFLVGYVIYHHFHGDTKYTGEGILRTIYFFILITHIVLSMVMVPLVFTTLFHAFKKNYIKHKKFAKITFPIWLYVSVTGVAIYFFLR